MVMASNGFRAKAEQKASFDLAEIRYDLTCERRLETHVASYMWTLSLFDSAVLELLS